MTDKIKQKLLEDKDLRKFVRQFISFCKEKCKGCEADIDAIIDEIADHTIQLTANYYNNFWNNILKGQEIAHKDKVKEIIEDVQEYLDNIDAHLVPFLYAHGIKLDRFAKIWEKIKKKHLEGLKR